MTLPTAYLTQDPSAPLIFLLQISAIYAGPAAPPAAQAPVIPLPRLGQVIKLVVTIHTYQHTTLLY